MPTTYAIETAKSGRAGCKKCKEKIAKGVLRIGAKSKAEDDDRTFIAWYHLECFVIPRKYKTEYSKEEFLDEMIEDDTEDSVLDSEEIKADIITKMGSNADASSKKNAAKKRDRDAGDDSGFLHAIKANAEKLALYASTEEDEDAPPRDKKIKITSMEQKQAEAYNHFSSLKNAELQDLLRWNNQITGGKKDILLMRVIDGATRGRLPKCPACTHGRLKLEDGGCKIVCSGYFNEENAAYEKCFAEFDLDNVERLHWFNEAPTEEEEENMKAEGKEPSTSPGDLPAEFLKSVQNIEWDVGVSKDKATIKNTATSLAQLLLADGSPIDVAESGESKVKMTVGKIILQNKDKSMDEILDLVVQNYGLKKTKEKASKARAKTTASLCSVKANGKIYEVIMDLADAYSKESNTNAANTYRKVAQTVKNLEFEITVKNAKGLGGGKKTKVAGIGKKSAEYMLEFLKTGKIEKLEEKKASFA